MGLIANGFRLAHGTTTFLGGAGTLASSFAYDRGPWSKAGKRKNRFVGDASISSKSAIPEGYLAPSAWLMPNVGGGMSATGGRISGAGTVTASGAAGINAQATIQGVGSVSNALAAAVAAMVASLSGSGSVTATASGVAALQALITGTGSLTAEAQALADMAATILGVGSLTAQQWALAFIEATISTAGQTLTADQVAAAVWEESAAAHNSTGTMGEKMNAAGTAGNPWTEEIEPGYTAEELLRLLAAAMLGKVSGAETSTVQFMDVNDTIVRIEADVDADGNRLVITLDPT